MRFENSVVPGGRRSLLRRAAAIPLAMLLLPARLRAMSRMPPGRSIYRLKGAVTVDGVRATEETKITANSTVETGPGAEVVFVVGSDAFMLRESSRITLEGSGKLIDVLRILTGKLLSVHGHRAKEIRTPIATIGIRGTGVYVESAPRSTYVCTCYGVVDMSAVSDPRVEETVKTHHHDSPRFIREHSAGPPTIEPAPVIDHTDAELILIESLVGRTPPFARAGMRDGPDGGGGY